MQKLIRLIAWKYLLGTKQEKSISTMVKVCFIGILIGTFSLALIVSIMNGFEKATHSKIQNIHPQIIMQENGCLLNFNKIKEILKKEFSKEIAAICPSNMEQIILQDETTTEINTVVILEGIDPAEKINVSNIKEKIISEEKNFNKILSQNKILIGEKLAKSMDLSIGDSINLLLPQTQKIKKNKISLEKSTATIGGVFKTGIDDFDKKLSFCSLNFFEKLFPESGITHIEIKLKNNINEQNIISKLKDRFQIQVYSWKELYPALISALKLEKYVMFIILALITLVASMNIISLLFMQIIKKKPDIAILKSMGLPENKIINIFLLMGLSISIFASLLGLLLAYICGLILESYPFITLPDVYYVTHLPIKMEFSIFILIFIVVILLSFISTLIPIKSIRKINISEVLRFDS